MKSSQIVPPSQQIIQSIVNDYLPIPSPRGASVSRDVRSSQLSASIKGINGTDIGGYTETSKQPNRQSPLYGQENFPTFNKPHWQNGDRYQEEYIQIANGNHRQENIFLNGHGGIAPQSISKKQKRKNKQQSSIPRYIESAAGVFPKSLQEEDEQQFLARGAAFAQQYQPYQDFKPNGNKDSNKYNSSATFASNKKKQALKLTEQQAHLDSQQEFPPNNQELEDDLVFRNGFNSLSNVGNIHLKALSDGKMQDESQNGGEEQYNIDKQIDKLLMQQEEFKESIRNVTGVESNSNLDNHILSDHGSRNLRDLDKFQAAQRIDTFNDQDDLKLGSTFHRRLETNSFSKRPTFTENTNTNIQYTQNRTGFYDQEDFFSQKSIGQKSSNLTRIQREDEKMEDYLKRSTLPPHQDKLQ